MKRICIFLVISLLYMDHANGQDSIVTLSIKNLSAAGGLNIYEQGAWFYHSGNDSNWAKNEIVQKDWKALIPYYLDASYADKNGRLEGWFRFKFKMDSSIMNLPFRLWYRSMAAADVYLDGKLFHQYGSIDEENKSFKFFSEIDSTRRVQFSGSEIHTLAIHVRDQLVYPSRKTGQMIGRVDFQKSGFVTIILDKYLYQFSGTQSNFIFFTSIWVFINALLSILFLLLFFLNKTQSGLLLYSGFCACSAIIFSFSYLNSWYSIGNNIRINSPESLLFIASIRELFFRIILFLGLFSIARVFQIEIQKLNRRLMLISLIVSLYSLALIQLYNIGFLTNINLILLRLNSFIEPFWFIGLMLFWIITSLKKSGFAQKIVAVGLVLTLFFFIISLALTYFLPAWDNEWISTAIAFCFPFSLLVFVAFRFREINKNILLNAQQIVALSDEKRGMAENQQKILEVQVAERTIELENKNHELEIETSLEKVRAQALGMRTPSDLLDICAILFSELKVMGFDELRNAMINIYEDDKTYFINYDYALWSGKTITKMPYNLHPLIDRQVQETKNARDAFNEFSFTGNELIAFRELRKSNGEQDDPKLEESSSLHYYFYSIGKGSIGISTYLPINENKRILLKRFRNVFDFAYRRYTDVANAESQAKESQIEASLERVRASAMSMHKSNQLLEVIKTVTDQLTYLGIEYEGANFVTINPDKSWLMWICTRLENFPFLMHIPYFHHKEFIDFDEAKMNGLDFYSYLLSPIENSEWMQHFFEKAVAKSEMPELTMERKEQLMQSSYQAASIFLFDEITLAIFRISDLPFSDAENAIFKRIGKVFEQAYIRFLDLKKAEAQSREALRSASLDRVRAEIASMRTTVDLEKITPLIWRELTVLNIPFVRCGVFIMDDTEEKIHTFLSTPDGNAIAAFHLPYSSTPLVESIDYWRNKKIYQSYWDLNVYTSFAKAVSNQGTEVNTAQYLSSVPAEGIHLHLIPFVQGMLYVGNTVKLKEADLLLIQSLADAFSTAYARYEDFNKVEEAKKQVEKTLSDLQSAQKQLIQSEKMASLGELTAGIAHEIQNPLNFVNNFSEVNTELIDELTEEADKGNIAEVKAIAKDIKENEEKINHHGKRADAIVKGMLQHSQASNGTKEPTDINALIDEYLRLVYHGLRAKDKSFNATLVTDFDESIGNINIIPQDIGRVILNLISNAFYAVDEKKKQIGEGYEPTVTVSTKNSSNHFGGHIVTISIGDNGNGIPPKIIDKIFQPFFTTKPTGQGTGLGLSLSYDIVKAHGGELKVDAKEGEGSNFIIKFP